MYELGGTGTRNDFIGTPVVYDNKVYIGVGQDPEHSTGVGHFWCIDPTKKGDISQDRWPKDEGRGRQGEVGEKPNPNSCEVWHYGGEDKRQVRAPRLQVRPDDEHRVHRGRRRCTSPSLHGYLHCLDAKTGKKYWQYDTKAAIWGSPYYVDGKVYLATEGGDLFVLQAREAAEGDRRPGHPGRQGREGLHAQAAEAKRSEVEKEYLLGKSEFDAAIRSTPVVANGVLYVMTEKTLYALEATKK